MLLQNSNTNDHPNNRRTHLYIAAAYLLAVILALIAVLNAEDNDAQIWLYELPWYQIFVLAAVLVTLVLYVSAYGILIQQGYYREVIEGPPLPDLDQPNTILSLKLSSGVTLLNYVLRAAPFVPALLNYNATSLEETAFLNFLAAISYISSGINPVIYLLGNVIYRSKVKILLRNIRPTRIPSQVHIYNNNGARHSMILSDNAKVIEPPGTPYMATNRSFNRWIAALNTLENRGRVRADRRVEWMETMKEIESTVTKEQDTSGKIKELSSNDFSNMPRVESTV